MKGLCICIMVLGVTLSSFAHGIAEEDLAEMCGETSILDLSGRELSLEDVRVITDFCKKNGISRLCLSETNIGDDGAEIISYAFDLNSTLIALDLSNNKIGVKGMAMISGALLMNTALKELNLSNNNIGDEGVKELAVALMVNTTLKSLNLSYNSITPEVQQMIDKALTTLDLSANL